MLITPVHYRGPGAVADNLLRVRRPPQPCARVARQLRLRPRPAHSQLRGAHYRPPQLLADIPVSETLHVQKGIRTPTLIGHARTLLWTCSLVHKRQAARCTAQVCALLVTAHHLPVQGLLTCPGSTCCLWLLCSALQEYVCVCVAVRLWRFSAVARMVTSWREPAMEKLASTLKTASTTKTSLLTQWVCMRCWMPHFVPDG